MYKRNVYMDTQRIYGVDCETMEKVIEYLLYEYYMNCLKKYENVKEVSESEGFKHYLTPMPWVDYSLVKTGKL